MRVLVRAFLEAALMFTAAGILYFIFMKLGNPYRSLYEPLAGVTIGRLCLFIAHTE